MSRSVRDLRDLLCVSRLSYQDSDEGDAACSDEEGVRRDLSGLQLSDSAGSSSSPGSAADACSPDSGFLTNGSPEDKGDGAQESGAAGKLPGRVKAGEKPKNRLSKKKRKRGRPENPASPQLHIPKPALLPPVPSHQGLFDKTKILLEDVNKQRPLKPEDFEVGKKGDFDEMLTYMDATIVAEWLTRANCSLKELTAYCWQGENFVQFGHFWLGQFQEVQRQEIYQMEYEILVEEVGLAFAVGKEAGNVSCKNISKLVSAVFREYPGRLIRADGTHLFLDYLDILTSARTDQYKMLLSDVRCATQNRQYAQWLLATRSFALVSVWSAIVNFYRNLVGPDGAPPGPSVCRSAKESVHQQRLMQAVRLGFVDIAHYYAKGACVDFASKDSQGRSLLFTAVMNKQPDMVHFLSTKVKCVVDVNEASDTGNTVLHAAANSGNADVVKVLVRCPGIVIDSPNPQCEGATPLHLAVMHGHKAVVEALIAAGADSTVKMGQLSAADIARDFNHPNLLSFLLS